MDTAPAAGGPLHGADVDALLETALAFAQTADLLELVDLSTYEGLAALRWDGQDAQRFREAWDAEHAVTLHLAAGLLRTGAEQLLREADEQEAVSTDGAAGTSGAAGAAGPAGPGGSAAPAPQPSRWAALRERMSDLVTTTVATALETVRRAGLVGAAVDAATVLGHLRTRAVQGLGEVGLVARATDASIGPVTAAGLHRMGQVGTVVSAHDALVGYAEGDWWRATDGTVSTGFGVGAALSSGNPWVVGGGAAWAIGGAVGDGVNHVKEGTRYDEHFQRRMEPAFDVGGVPAGMVWTPVALAQAGGDTIGEVVNEAKEGTRYDEHFQRYMDGAFEVGGLPAGILATPGALAAAGVDSAVEAGREALTEAADAVRRVHDAATSPTPWSWHTLSAAPPEDATETDGP